MDGGDDFGFAPSCQPCLRGRQNPFGNTMRLGFTEEPFEIIPIYGAFVPANQSRGYAFDNRRSNAPTEQLPGAQRIRIPLGVPEEHGSIFDHRAVEQAGEGANEQNVGIHVITDRITWVGEQRIEEFDSPKRFLPELLTVRVTFEVVKGYLFCFFRVMKPDGLSSEMIQGEIHVLLVQAAIGVQEQVDFLVA